MTKKYASYLLVLQRGVFMCKCLFFEFVACIDQKQSSTTKFISLKQNHKSKYEK